MLKSVMLGFVLFFVLPLGLHAAVHWSRDWPDNWRTADWTSSGELPAAAVHEAALVRIYAAPAGRWRGIFSLHSWVVLKDRGGAYERYDKVGWGTPIRVNGYAPDARWFGRVPQVVFAADGATAERLIPRLRQAITDYRFRHRGGYRIWPGPNSNTFVAAVMAATPEIGAVLPPNAVGRDFPHDGTWFGRTASGSGLRVSLGGYAGLVIGWVEGLEINLFGAVVGLDLRRPALKLPGFGRIGLPRPWRRLSGDEEARAAPIRGSSRAGS